MVVINNISDCRSRCRDCEFNKICLERGFILKYRNRYSCEHYDTYMEAKMIVNNKLIYVEGEVK